MNYGKYFRLNLKESKVVDGVSVYDYIDLPAYFGPSKAISPKFPVTLVISNDAVRFRIHYCTYRLQDANKREVAYEYNPVVAFDSVINDNLRTVHMQEVILELPFCGAQDDTLASNIREIYATRFPQLTEDDADYFKEGFLNQLLKKRYASDSESDLFGCDEIEKKSYENLRNNNDGDRSFSTIWLMDIQKEKERKYIELDANKTTSRKQKSSFKLFRIGKRTENHKLRFEDNSFIVWDAERKLVVGTDVKYEKDDKIQNIPDGVIRVAGKIIKIKDGRVERIEEVPRYESFLRKLLLDFMFDLAHSDVFQSDAHYIEMQSGLMSDALFSSLMHKCEYYYYRGLTLDALEEIEKSPQKAQDEKREKNDKKERVKMLYATHLLDAEKKWVEDIMNPASDLVFQEPQDDFAEDWKSRGKRKSKISRFRIYDYWFASPEEEMQRICFSMKSPNRDKTHLCNSETLAHYLDVKNTSAIKRLRTKISKWFFKRYDFQDAWRLHLFNGFAMAEFFILIAAIVLFMVFPDVVDQQFWTSGSGKFIAIELGGILVSLTMVSAYCAFIRPLLHRRKDDENRIKKSILWSNRVTLAWIRVFWFLSFFVVFIGLVFVGASSLNPIWKIIGLVLWVGFIVLFAKKTSTISNIHVLYPRLFASITAAWLTLAIGNELFSAFFDASPSFLACLFLGIIVFVFILYEINRHYPLLGSWTKIGRSLQMLVYSYAISLIVGLFIINFTGREFLERSDYLPKFFEEYVVIPDNTVAQLSSKSVETAYGDSLLLAENTTADSSLAASANISHTDSTTHPQAISHAEKGDERHNKRHQFAPREHRAWRRPSGISEPVPGSNRYLLEELERRPVPGKNHSIASVWRAGEKPLFFILRDFLIQFAFLAMFIGVFIQMIFEEKSLTEM